MKEDRITKLVTEEKQKKYGNAVDSLMSCANFWDLALRRCGWDRECKLTAREVCELMILFKVSRDLKVNNEDNITDIQGYARIIEMFEEVLKDLRKTEMKRNDKQNKTNN